MKKKMLLISTTASLVAIIGATLAVSNLENYKVFALNGGDVWYHYARIEPTETTHGSKEFWASSNDGCLTHYFEQPDANSFIERDFSTNQYFEDLTMEDDRFIPSLAKQRDLGMIPVIDNLNKTITYGLYPQSNVDDADLIDSLNSLPHKQLNDWYLFNGDFYATINANIYVGATYLDYQFDNGIDIENGKKYWFKCEPITWRILSGNGSYYLLSDLCLDTSDFYDGIANNYQMIRTINGKKIYANNYEYSDIREFLNNAFYNNAFALNNEHIALTGVANGKQTTTVYNSENKYCCEDTMDKVFLPSYKDYINTSYGFSQYYDTHSAKRICVTTDWARARKVYPGSSQDTLYNAICYTRSPHWANNSGEGTDVWAVQASGDLWTVGPAIRGVRPAITLTI